MARLTQYNTVWTRRSSQWSLLLVLISVLCQQTIVTVAEIVIFGSENGYDAGGRDAVCWSSFLDDSVVSDGGNYTNVEILNEELYATNASQTVSIMRSCYNGTSLDFEPLDLNTESRKLTTEVPATFRLMLNTDVSKISAGNNNEDLLNKLGGESFIHVRLILCDAIEQGFCNPLFDTLDLEKSWTPADTDVGKTDVDEFPQGDDKWKYTPGEDTLLGIEKGPLVFSRWCKWKLRQVSEQSPSFQTSIDITFQLPKGTREGAYFVIGHAIMDFDLGDDSGLVQRIDVAQAIPDNVVEVRHPPRILTVSRSMKIGLGVVIGLSVWISLVIAVFGLYHQHHPVMKLAQGSFLVAIAVASAVQIGGTYFFLPLSDLSCAIAGPLVLIPTTFVGACLVGRIWRVYSTLSNVQSMGRLNKNCCGFGDGLIAVLTFLAKLSSCRPEKHVPGTRKSRRQSIRQTVTARETTCLILVLTIPQVIIQVLSSIWLEQSLDTVFDSTGKIGRVVCSQDERWGNKVSTGYAGFIYILAVVIAWLSRSLPAAFNEKDQIFHSSAMCTFIVFTSISLQAIMNDPSTEPDFQVFLQAMPTIAAALLVMILIVVPKMTRVLSGEKVVLSKVLGARYSASQTSTAESVPPANESQRGNFNNSISSNAGSTMMQSAAQITFNVDRIAMKKDDPLPAAVEVKIHEVHGLLRDCERKFTEGRPLLRREIARMKQLVGALHDELDTIDYTRSPSSRHFGITDQSSTDRSDRATIN